MNFEVYVVFDDRCSKPGFLEGFGFSALVYNHLTKNYILFDTGDNGKKLLKNINKFDVELDDIKSIVISHKHFDHAGGLKYLYSLRKDLNIFVPGKYEGRFKKKFPEAEVIGVNEQVEIDSNVYSSGEFGDHMREQALFLKTTDDKIILLSGCAHPGLEKFIIKSKQVGEIIAVIGGFHGFNKYSYLEGINFIGGCHCTQHTNTIKEKYPEQFKQVCVGDKLSF
jgi:7,8-dihydropterin-6-yl-methyl-4-(beta-D-ribofuranosyl)aminobenzene 5'-phosphate synthase